MARLQPAFPHLFSPVIIRGQVIRNRIVSAPHAGGPNIFAHTASGKEQFTPEAARYYGAIARGGAGIVVTGQCGVDPYYKLSTNQFDFFDDSTLSTMHMVTDAIHAFGAKAAIELNHAGKFAAPSAYGDPIGPCECTVKNSTYVHQMAREDGKEDVVHVRQMSVADMERVADCFADAAVMAQRGGFDILFIHAGHGWLLHQFLSPHENKRTDEFGGCVENRVKFPAMVLDRVRQAVGNDMIIELRCSVNEFVEDGVTMGEAIRTAQLLQDKIDILQCSVGIRSGMHSLVITHPTFFLKEACNSYLAREMKKHLHVYVDVIGAIGRPETAEQLLAEGACDFVAMARSHIADPDWGNKAKAGHPEDIRPCIRCLRCLYTKSTGDCRCSVNPSNTWASLERTLVRPAGRRKKILVVGGGPSGMQAALKAAERGHQVALYEQSGQLGGQLNHAKFVSFKAYLDQYMRYLITQVQKEKNITLHLGHKADAGTALAEEADAVVVAVGAGPVYPPIPGLDSPHVLPAVDCFAQGTQVGQHVVILGGGPVGCEAAIHFSGMGREVTILEAADRLMAREKDPHIRYHTLLYLDHEYDRDTAMLDQARPMPGKVKTRLNCRCTKICPGHVLTEDQDGTVHKLKADTVILAAGMAPKTAERDAFWGSADTVIPVGDCLKATNLHDAVRTGYFAALQL